MKDFRRPLSMRLRGLWLITACSTLDRSPELEESLLWIYKSHQRVEQQIAPFWTAGTPSAVCRSLGSHTPTESFRTLLDRMISITRGLFPASAIWPGKCAIATSISRCLSEARKQVYAQAEDHLAYLAANPDAADLPRRDPCADRLSAALAGLFAARFRRRRSRLAPTDVGGSHLAVLPRFGP